ncbi:hypothetical protein SLEP1_g52918 [Rubroshorea leprosula]|uniref:Uncharacterized protein n=1 Tax=Rubroshorea leprosula TaxID=152421 RepID=A0AAV5M7S8_9ROSI|nr:hypothetical protein SLEP1_g52918 [Rubroshorea leprosula]
MKFTTCRFGGSQHGNLKPSKSAGIVLSKRTITGSIHLQDTKGAENQEGTKIKWEVLVKTLNLIVQLHLTHSYRSLFLHIYNLVHLAFVGYS